MARNTRHVLPPAQEEETEKLPPGFTPKALSKQEFGRRLYDLMIRANMNQSELARRAGLRRDSISTYVRGLVFPEPKSLRKLANVFKMEPHELLPNTLQSALDNEVPALEIRMAQGHPDKVWLRINQMVDIHTAARVFEALKAPMSVPHVGAT